ncbi:MAG: radical SAM protein [Conexivisphaerales archaeon]|jgi:radical SAM superfamily enzyme YgiQ (UPF0313 family)
MARFVLISDTTLSCAYRDFPLLYFLPCAPTEILPSAVYRYLKGSPAAAIDGRASRAPYSIRKLEASLLKESSPDEVVVAHEDYIENFIDEETEVIGLTTMDPLGLGPLAASYAVLFATQNPPYVRREFEALTRRVNRARAGKKAKLIVGGPGVWELVVLPEEMNHLGIDYAFQGEADDIVSDLFRFVTDQQGGSNEFYRGFQTSEGESRKRWVDDDRFISRHRFSRQFPSLEDIPEIVNPSMRGLVEVMRGCGIGCDFCEVTLRPPRYYPTEKIKREIEVNVRAGISHPWLHSDEIFTYQHGRNFSPNSEALEDLFRAVMGAEGVAGMNPTHGRISVPAAYPELLARLSGIVKAGPSNWVGMQVGIETGSDRLAKIHMPNKTLPLRVGPDGSWEDIVREGTYAMNRCYWRPALTLQVGQMEETPEDNWATVALINRMSNSELEGGRPFEFTVTPMQNIPLGLLKSRDFRSMPLDASQLAVYYASYRHLAKMASRDAFQDARGDLLSKVGTGLLISLGARAMLHTISTICRKGGLDLEKAARYGVDGGPTVR